MSTHQSHPDVVMRLKRAEGHLRSIIDMLQEGRSCVEVAQQLQAVEGAISSAKRVLVHDHVDHCLEKAVRDGSHNEDDLIREFKAMIRYL